jgi:hypothetical protein
LPTQHAAHFGANGVDDISEFSGTVIDDRAPYVDFDIRWPAGNR